MALKQIREFPGTLPSAHLYLDDISDISEILLKAHKEVFEKHESEYLAILNDEQLADKRRKNEPKVRYTFGERDYGATAAESIEDLRTAGGSATTFRIAVGSYTEIRLSWFSEPHISLVGLDSLEQSRSVYQQIHAVFVNRQLALTNALRTLPGWMRITFWFAFAFLVFPSLEFIHGSTKQMVFLTCALLFLWFSLLYAYARPSRVFFMDSHEKFKLRSIARRGYIRDIFFTVLGGAIALLVQLLLKKMQ